MQKRFTALLLAIALCLSLAACGQRGQDEPEPQGPLSGELTVSLPSRWGPLEIWAGRFEEIHPDVEIQFQYETEETYIDPPSGITFEGEIVNERTELPTDVADSYIRKTVTSLSGGEAADILDLGPMSYFKYAKSGLFEDLNEWMARDPEFSREDYYTNILEALEDTEGHLYAVPPVVRFKFIMLNDYILYEMGLNGADVFPDGVNYEDLTDLFQQAAAMGALEPASKGQEGCYFAPRTNKSFFLEFVLPQYLDEKTGEARFDTPEFIEYLKRTDELPFEYTMDKAPGRSLYWPSFSCDGPFCQKVSSSMHVFNKAVSDRDIGSSRGLLYKDSQGNIPFSTDMALLAIPKGPNAQLAWEFLKFIIEEKEFPDSVWKDSVSENYEYVHPYNQSLPINRNNFRNLSAALFREPFAKLAEPYMEQLNTRLSVSQELLGSLEDIFAAYYDNHLISAEECARQLQERGWIYLNE
ncbi:ABC transporter substrate-binding protein [Acutalibacter muris]|uniref:ABC transporter substrate-binding protein n=1 Tax=Acutalibacter muris TaxID=1796620 RepID=UPI00272E746E|nr:hypothetical protein [Acutalibacter muris]